MHLVPFLGSEFIIPRIDPRLHKRPESHVSGWLALAGIENVKPKGRPVQPMDFALALFLLTSFRRIFNSERSRQVLTLFLPSLVYLNNCFTLFLDRRPNVGF